VVEMIYTKWQKRYVLSGRKGIYQEIESIIESDLRHIIIV
jgi:hypothetical protein